MTPRAPLVQLGKLVAKDLASGLIGEMTRGLGDALSADPNAALELLDLMAREGMKKKPSIPLIDAYAFMIGQVLEVLRYQIEHGFSEADQKVANIRSRLTALIKNEKQDLMLGIMVARQFTAARIDLGDELRDLMAVQMETQAAARAAIKTAVRTDNSSMTEGDAFFANLAQGLGDDAFLIHSDLAETGSVFPDEHRAAMGAMLLEAPKAAIREAALGWLLDSSATVRRSVATALRQAAGRGVISDTMLRRMIVVRNWLPDDDRSALDEAIKACRQKGIACATAPSMQASNTAAAVQIRNIAASGLDGSGAQSIFVMVKVGRKHAIAALLVKLGVGVRDAWVRHDLNKAEAENFLWTIEQQVDLHETSIEYILTALQHFLAVSRMTGALPPFGLVDFIETVGVAGVNPEPIQVAELVNQILENIPPAQRTPTAITKAIKGSRSWTGNHPFMDTWFEGDATVCTLLDGKQMTPTRQAALVLEELLPARRSRWAETLAWTALLLQEGEEDAWMDFALIAQELLGDRPLTDIPFMHDIAKTTVSAWRYHKE